MNKKISALIPLTMAVMMIMAGCSAKEEATTAAPATESTTAATTAATEATTAATTAATEAEETTSEAETEAPTESTQATEATKATEAKMCRGYMVRYMAERNIQDLEEIKKFDYKGYLYSVKDSNESEWVFVKEL